MCILCICIWWCNVRYVYSLYLYLVVQSKMSFPGQRIAQWVRGRDPQPALPPIEPRFQLSALFCIFISVLFAFLTFHSYFVFVVIHFACIFVFVTGFIYQYLFFSKDCAAFPRIMIWFSSHRYHHAAISEIDKKSVRWRQDHHCAQMAPFNARLEYNQPTFLPY